jgi:hypothetical protein
VWRHSAFAGRLLAEAVRIHEEALGHPLQEPAADEAARAAGDDFEQRLIVRARVLSLAPTLRSALDHLRGGTLAAVAVVLAAAVAAGAAAARVALGSDVDGPVNVFWVLASLLGVHTLALALWVMLVLLRPGSTAIGVLGGLVLELGRRITRRVTRDQLAAAAAQAAAGVFASGRLGRWLLSSISHAVWLAFLTGCLALVLLLLSTRQYDFSWETTILSERAYVTLTRLIAVLPEAFGFPAPDAGQISASGRETAAAAPAGARQVWAGLLVGCLVVYGLLPRGLALAVSVAALARGRRQYRLDTRHIGFARLQPRLMPPSRPKGIVDAEQPGEATAAAMTEAMTEAVEPLQIGAAGPVAIFGLEIEPPGSMWPPPVSGIDWIDLGFVDNRFDRQRVLDALTAAAVPPGAVVAVCSLAATPDRGTGTFLARLQHACRIPVVLVLTGGQQVRRRGPHAHIEQRIDDWRRLAANAGVGADRVIELDLDHLTDVSGDTLAALFAAGKAPTAAPAGRIERAFALILDHAGRWSGPPDASAQADLHLAIAALYRGETQRWRDLLTVPLTQGGDRLQALQAGANRMLTLLPSRLHASPGWLSAGAIAGALGCVTLATFVAPAAIAALPVWAGLGAAVAAVLGQRRGEPGTPSAERRFDLTEAVHAAALFALVLELQGRGESAITRIIDRVAIERDPPALADTAAVRSRLEILLRRLHEALAAEDSP